MDRHNLSEAIIQELGDLFMDSLRRAGPWLIGAADLDALETQVQTIGRQVLGRVVEASVCEIAATMPSDKPICAQCKGPMRLVDGNRPRHLQGIVGDYEIKRAYHFCDSCRVGVAPLDGRLGLGVGALSPGLGRVACRLGIETSFEQASGVLEETLKVMVATEAIRRVTESVGAVAEEEQQAMVAKAEKGQLPRAKVDESKSAGMLVVEVDGAMVHLEDGWREVKTGVVAPLGPQVEIDRETGRERLVLERQVYVAGFEPAEVFWYRVYVEACKQGLGNLVLALVVVLGDGADWIWRYAQSFLALAGVQVVGIVDIFHAWEHLWQVGNGVYGQGSVAAAAWVEPLKKKLLEEGAGAVIEALTALSPPEHAVEEVRKATAYFTGHSERMRYPEFIARKLPIGSGAVESACKTVIGQREDGPGMCWSKEGAQAVATLRAIHRSSRWGSFWSTQPMMRRTIPAAERHQAQAKRANTAAA